MVNAEATLKIYNEYIDVFTELRFFKGTFFITHQKLHEAIPGTAEVHRICNIRAI